jgi:hypothetical protein
LWQAFHKAAAIGGAKTATSGRGFMGVFAPGTFICWTGSGGEECAKTAKTPRTPRGKKFPVPPWRSWRLGELGALFPG